MKLLYEGKAKRVFQHAENADWVVLEFKNSLTAFNALKTGEFDGKGALNRNMASLIFNVLDRQGIKTHWVKDVDEASMIVRSLKMIPLEVVVRNYWAGFLAKRFGKPEGDKLPEPLVEFYFKDDALADPFLSEEQIRVLDLAPGIDITALKKIARDLNRSLSTLFEKANLILADFKVEFGKDPSGQIFLADEISPDSCRLWDVLTKEKMDKDRFRRDLGNVSTAYQEVYNRLKGVKV